MSKMKLVDTGEKSRVLTFRLGGTVYTALEELANTTGNTISATARMLLNESLVNEVMKFRAGDTLIDSDSCATVILVGDNITEEDIRRRLKRLVSNEPEENNL